MRHIRSQSIHIAIKISSLLCIVILFTLSLLISVIRFYDADIRKFTQNQSLVTYVREHFNIDLQMRSHSYTRKLDHLQAHVSDLSLKTSYFDLSIKDANLSLFLFENFFPHNVNKISTLSAKQIKINLKNSLAMTSQVSKAGKYSIKEWLNELSSYLQIKPYIRKIFLFITELKITSLIPLQKKMDISLNDITILAPKNTMINIKKAVYNSVKNPHRIFHIAIPKIHYFNSIYKGIVIDLVQNFEHEHKEKKWNFSGNIQSINTQEISKYINHPINLQFEGDFVLTPSPHQLIALQGAIQGIMNDKQKFASASEIDIVTNNGNMVMSLTLLNPQLDSLYLGDLYALIDFSHHSIELSSRNFELNTLALLSPSSASELNIENVHGRIDKLLLSYNYAENSIKNFIVNIPDANINLDTNPYLNRINNVDLSYFQTNDQKSLKVSIPNIKILLDANNSTNSTINLSNISLNLNLLGDLQALEKIKVNASSITINNSSFLQLDGKYKFNEKNHNNLQLHLLSNNANIEDIRPLLVKIPEKHDLAWMRNLIAGAVKHFEFHLHDHLDKIDVFHKEKKLYLTVKSDSVKLFPYEGWSLINAYQVAATYQFDKFKDILSATATKVIDVQSKASANNVHTFIDFYHPAHIRIKGEVQSQKNQAIQFIQSSPIPKLSDLEEFWKEFTISGDIRGNVNIYIPLDETASPPVNINLNLTTKKALIQYKKWAYHHAKGNFNIQDNFINTSTFTGLIANQSPAQFRIIKPIDKHSQTVEYTITFPKIENFSNSVKGKVSFSGNIKYNPQTFSPFQYTLASSLKGVSINLPAPLNKKSTEKKPLYVHITQQNNDTNINAFYGKDKLTATYNHKKNHIEPLVLIIGKRLIQQHQQEKESYISINTPYININEWLTWIETLSTSKSTFNIPTIPIAPTSIKSDKITIKDNIFTQNQLTIKFSSPKKFNAQLLSNEADLTINGLEGNYLDVIIHKLDLPWKENNHQQKHYSTTTKTTSEKLDCYIPDYNNLTFPKISIKGKNIKLNHSPLATFSAQGSLKDNILAINKLNYTNSDIQIVIQDFIYQQNKKNPTGSTRFNSNIRTKSLSSLLSQFAVNYPNYVADNIKINSNFHWKGAPWCVTKNNIFGEIQAKTGVGTVKGIEPGAGRLLALLNLKILFERFNDNKEIRKRKDALENKGLVFNSTELNAKINNHIINVNKLRIDSPIAVIKLKGKMNHISNKYDFIANVKPEILPTIVTLSTIFGTPVGGIIALLSSKILSALNLDDLLLTYDVILKGKLNDIKIIKKASTNNRAKNQ